VLSFAQYINNLHSPPPSLWQTRRNSNTTICRQIQKTISTMERRSILAIPLPAKTACTDCSTKVVEPPLFKVPLELRYQIYSYPMEVMFHDDFASQPGLSFYYTGLTTSSAAYVLVSRQTTTQIKKHLRHLSRTTKPQIFVPIDCVAPFLPLFFTTLAFNHSLCLYTDAVRDAGYEKRESKTNTGNTMNWFVEKAIEYYNGFTRAVSSTSLFGVEKGALGVFIKCMFLRLQDKSLAVRVLMTTDHNSNSDSLLAFMIAYDRFMKTTGINTMRYNMTLVRRAEVGWELQRF
ncbi:hypothetical protein P280DRAFT_70385, partial [Massarina eburnea CBS 473.64]